MIASAGAELARHIEWHGRRGMAGAVGVDGRAPRVGRRAASSLMITSAALAAGPGAEQQ